MGKKTLYVSITLKFTLVGPHQKTREFMFLINRISVYEDYSLKCQNTKCLKSTGTWESLICYTAEHTVKIDFAGHKGIFSSY